MKELPDNLKVIYDSMLMSVDTNISLEDVILSEENKFLIKEFLEEVRYADQLRDAGLQPMNRLLFYGASGCGKTFLAKALSNYLGYTMLYVDIAAALSSNKVAENIQDIFALANYLENCIIFLDECDSIAWNRDSDGDTGVIRRATNSLFQHLDQMNPTNIFISATNLLHRCDPAFERRFNLKMKFVRPEADIKETVLQFVGKSNKFAICDDASDVDEDIVRRRTFLSYSEIQDVARRAMKKAVIDGSHVVRTSDIYRMFKLILGIKTELGTAEIGKEV